LHPNELTRYARFGHALATKVCAGAHPLKVPPPNQIVVQRRKARARLLELFDAPSRRQRDVVRVHRMLPDWRNFGEARPVATTIEPGLFDGRVNIKIEVSA
jgi:hypothetical protein